MFKTILAILLALAIAAPAIAQDAPAAKEPAAKEPAAKEPAAKEPAAPPPMDMSKVGPGSRKIKSAKKVRKSINAFLKAGKQAWEKQDLPASMAQIDFPVLMITDDSKDEGSGMMATKEQYEAMMKPFYEMPKPKGMKMSMKHAITLMTESLATVVTSTTINMKVGKKRKKMKFKSASLIIRKGGEWKYKSMAEGGWGDMMGQEAKPAK